jgi:hypothetical protein
MTLPKLWIITWPIHQMITEIGLCCRHFKICYIVTILVCSIISKPFKSPRACLLNKTAQSFYTLIHTQTGSTTFHQMPELRRLPFFCQGMMISHRIVRTSFYITMLDIFSASKIPIPSILPCTMFCSILLASWVGTALFYIRRWKISKGRPSTNICLWLSFNTYISFLVLYTFSPTISFFLASSFKSMSMRYGLFLNKTASIIIDSTRNSFM